MKTPAQIMYLEKRTTLSAGYARIGRVQIEKDGSSILYNGKSFRPLKQNDFTYNYFDIETGELYWISSCKENGEDRLHNFRCPVFIDENAREEYWTDIRNAPTQKHLSVSNI